MSGDCIRFIEVRTVHEFVKNLTKDMRKEFYYLMKNARIGTEKVHAPYGVEVEKKSFLGKFHQHFVQKVILNVKKEDWSCQKLSSLVSIFPFKVSNDVVESELIIFRNIDSEFEDDIKKFLQNHFDDVGDVPGTIKLFLRNIRVFKSSIDAHQLVKPSSGVSDGDHVEQMGDLLRTNLKIGDETRSIPKLTKEGVKRFLNIYSLTRRAMLALSPSQAETICFDKFDETYFLGLPESNFVELYSLLDPNFYKTQCEQYKQLFEKYIFFFLHALRSENHPVFFIDHLLFECLKSYHIFQKSRENPVHLKSHIGNLTSAYQRLQCNDEANDFAVSDESLNEIKKFFETGIRGIETAQLNYSVENALLDNRTFACTNHELIDVCFSSAVKDKPLYFIDLIIVASFSEKYFNRLSVYNLYKGVKTWIYNPSCKDEVLKFVRKYTKYERRELPPEFFLMEKFENCFENV